MSGIISGIKKVMPINPSAKQMGTQTPPKQQTQADRDKMKKKDPNAIVDIKAEDTAYAGGMGQGGNAGQSYRKYKVKPAGMKEEQAPMFTPEAKMVNANDPMSDGWRLYNLKEEAVNVVKKAIVDQVKKSKINLVQKYGIKPLITAINQVAQKHAATPEKSLSDISIWIKELENMLERGKGGTFEEQQLDEKCWDTHKQVGMKNKGGRMVPNCIPKESVENVSEISDFKKKEIEYELRNEPKNNYQVSIDGRAWKVFADKAHAEAVARKLRAKGKKAEVHLTGARVSETIDESATESDLAMALQKARQITRQIKYDDTAMEIVVQIQMLAEKYNIDKDSLDSAINDVYDAKNKLESAVYGLDEVFADALQQAKLNNDDELLDEDLRKWFKEKWVRFGPDGKIRGDCARGSSSEGKPKCLPQSKAHALGKKGRASAAARKRREDPNPERHGKAKNVATKKKTSKESSVLKGMLEASTDTVMDSKK